MPVAVLMYHRVGVAPGDPRYTVAPRLFEAQLALLARAGYQSLSLPNLVEALRAGRRLPAKAIALTFDDGFRETYDNACPLLKRFAFPATFFVVTTLIGRTSVWMDRPDDASAPLFDWGVARALLADGFTLGSHSASHRSLPGLPHDQVVQEITGSKHDLEDRLGRAVDLFAYPYGHFGPRESDLVAHAGYRGACSVQSGFNSDHTPPYAIRRLDVSGRHSLATFARNLAFGENDMTLRRALAYYARRLASTVSAAPQRDGR